MTWLHQPLVALDTETTGTDPETDDCWCVSLTRATP